MNLRDKLMARLNPVHIETAAGDNISLRTILIKAGGVKDLRGMAGAKAMTAIRKAASDLQAERKKNGKPNKVDRSEMTQWVKDNCSAKGSATAPKGKEAKGGGTDDKRIAQIKQALQKVSDDVKAGKTLSENRIISQSKLRAELKQLQSKTPAKPASKKTDDIEDFTDGKAHETLVKRDKDGKLSVGSTKLAKKADGTLHLHWKNGDEVDEYSIKGLKDIPKLAQHLKDEWDSWVEQYRKGLVTKKELTDAKNGYSEYVAVLGKAKTLYENDEAKTSDKPAKPEDPDTEDGLRKRYDELDKEIKARWKKHLQPTREQKAIKENLIKRMNVLKGKDVKRTPAATAKDLKEVESKMGELMKDSDVMNYVRIRNRADMASDTVRNSAEFQSGVGKDLKAAAANPQVKAYIELKAKQRMLSVQMSQSAPPAKGPKALDYSKLPENTLLDMRTNTLQRMSDAGDKQVKEDYGTDEYKRLGAEKDALAKHLGDITQALRNKNA